MTRKNNKTNSERKSDEAFDVDDHSTYCIFIFIYFFNLNRKRK